MIDTERIEAMARALDGSPVTELILTEENTELRLVRRPDSIPAANSLSSGKISATSEPVETLIRASRVGIYHHREPPVKPGDRIKAGEIVGFVESMRIMNELVAENPGEVTHVLIQDGAPVEYGQELIALAGETI